MPAVKERDRTQEHLSLFKRITSDERRAFCQGDIDLDDLVGDASELPSRTRRKLRELLDDWGKRNGVEL